MSTKLLVRHLRCDVKVAELDEDGQPKRRLIGVKADGKTTVTAPSFKIVTLRRGEPLPDGLMDGELDRLKKLNAVGTAEQVANVERTAGTPFVSGPLESRTGSGATPPPPEGEVDLSTLGALDDDQLAAAVASTGVAKLVEAVGDNQELAGKVLAAENARGGEARSTLVKPLTKLVEGSSS